MATGRRRLLASAVIQDFLPAPKPSALRLVRSFDVPADDPAAARMANLSWTYDSALASISMMFAGEKAQAEQLLDQLAALQRTDGSIDFAFNVADGSSLQQFRTGSIAWIGLAAATYGNLYRSTRYNALAAVRRAGCWPASSPTACCPAAPTSPGPPPSTTCSPGSS